MLVNYDAQLLNIFVPSPPNYSPYSLLTYLKVKKKNLVSLVTNADGVVNLGDFLIYCVEGQL